MGTFNDLPDPYPDYTEKQRLSEREIIAQIGWLNEKLKRNVAPYIGDKISPGLVESIKQIFEREIQALTPTDLGKDFLVFKISETNQREIGFYVAAAHAPDWVKQLLPVVMKF